MSFLYLRRDVSATHDEVRLLGCVRLKRRKRLQDACHYHHLPIERNKVYLRSVFGAYGCSPKYIAEEIRRQGLEWDLVWEVESHVLDYIDAFPKGMRLVMRGSQESMRELATAHIWVENERKTTLLSKGLFKRTGQVYIQTWHGSLGIKKTGSERHDATKSGIALCEADDRQMDYFISNAAYTTDFYRSVFSRSTGEVLEYGCPRNDIFFRTDGSELRRKVCERLGIGNGRKILLYAPTFREKKALSGYDLNHSAAIEALTKRFGGKWVEVARLHPEMCGFEETLIPSQAGVVDGTRYPDMQELLAVADAVITDYSSCIYDYLLTRRPGFIYAPDMADYGVRRGLRYPLTETPFPLAESNETLVDAILGFDMGLYAAKVEEFLRKKGSIDDGHASERVVRFIKSIIDKED